MKLISPITSTARASLSQSTLLSPVGDFRLPKYATLRLPAIANRLLVITSKRAGSFVLYVLRSNRVDN